MFKAIAKNKISFDNKHLEIIKIFLQILEIIKSK